MQPFVFRFYFCNVAIAAHMLYLLMLPVVLSPTYCLRIAGSEAARHDLPQWQRRQGHHRSNRYVDASVLEAKSRMLLRMIATDFLAQLCAHFMYL